MNKHLWSLARLALVMLLVGLFIVIIMNADPVVSNHEVSQGVEEQQKTLEEVRDGIEKLRQELRELREKQDQIEELIEQYANGKLKYA